MIMENWPPSPPPLNTCKKKTSVTSFRYPLRSGPNAPDQVTIVLMLLLAWSSFTDQKSIYECTFQLWGVVCCIRYMRACTDMVRWCIVAVNSRSDPEREHAVNPPTCSCNIHEGSTNLKCKIYGVENYMYSSTTAFLGRGVL